MYKAPIELISSPPQFDYDGEIYKAIVKCGVSVDKDELIKALRYDRDQYNKGYADAKAEVAREIFEEIDKVRVRFVLGTINKRELNEMLCYLKEKYTEGENV